MAPPELTARLKFLANSSHLLSLSAPETSRFLMSKCNTLLFDSELEVSTPQKRKSCGACGTLAVLGWEARLGIETEEGDRKKKKDLVKGKKKEEKKTMIYTCDACGAKNREVISKEGKRERYCGVGFRREKKPMTNSGSIGNLVIRGNLNENLSKVAKKRKKRNGGLEALLAQRREGESSGRGSGNGLNLMDFMRAA